LAEIGNPNLITDTGVAAILLFGAAQAARLNTLINAKFIHDENVKNDAVATAADLISQAELLAQTTARLVETHVTPAPETTAPSAPG
jgi:glutamate formiminotransferase/formiminotetrahydrofolate cyclodeaminase